MSVNPVDLLRREPVLTLLLALSAACAAIALVAGRNAATALAGALLVVAYWLVERLAARVGRDGPFGRAIAVGLGGMVVRLAIVVGGLVVIGLIDRAGFVEAAFSFVAVYTIYLGARLWRHPALGPGRPAR
jgi:hypothetical protein